MSAQDPGVETVRRKLEGAHSQLLDVHKALIDHERVRYEARGDKIAHSGEFLRLLLEDPFFAWLRTLSGLIVEVDEYISAKEPVTAGDGEALIGAARDLLTADERGDTFHREYARALQESPEVATRHARWRAFIK